MEKKIKQSDIKRAIKDIQKLDLDLRKLGTRATPDIVGFYGELLAWKELKSKFGWRGYNIGFGSGQSKAYIVLKKNGQKINIEVKTSRFKREWYGDGYGYALNIKKCKNHPGIDFKHPKKGIVNGDFCYFDYLIAILLSDNLRKAEFYIFPQGFIYKNEKKLRNRNPRFSSATHRMIFIKKERKSNEITSFDRKMKKMKSKFKNAWHLIKL